MMRKILIVILAVIAIIMCTGCDENSTSSRFVRLEHGFSHDIKYDKETKVMYIIGAHGNVTVMLDADGKPLLYEGE